MSLTISSYVQVNKAPAILLRLNSHQHSLQICENNWLYMKVSPSHY
jgi:hypothetical protein